MISDIRLFPSEYDASARITTISDEISAHMPEDSSKEIFNQVVRQVLYSMPLQEMKLFHIRKTTSGFIASTGRLTGSLLHLIQSTFDFSLRGKAPLTKQTFTYSINPSYSFNADLVRDAIMGPLKKLFSLDDLDLEPITEELMTPILEGRVTLFSITHYPLLSKVIITGQLQNSSNRPAVQITLNN